MKKILNDPADYVDEMIDGLIVAHPYHFRRVPSAARALAYAGAPADGKVGIVTGGGSGHLPTFLGYVGPGLADAVAIGNVFSSPSAEEILCAVKAVDSGEGVLFLFGNYAGDVMNFDMAAELAQEAGICIGTSIVTDDVASSPPDEKEERRGVAGLLFAYKAAGARAASGAILNEVKAAADKAISNTRSLGVALSPCTIPEVGRPTFELREDEMELGMGIHGEKGIERMKLATADEIASSVMERILADIELGAGDEVAILVNGLGATPLEELYILLRRAHDILRERQVSTNRAYVGEYATSMEMAGASISIMKLDSELKGLLDAPCYSPLLLQPPRERTHA